jgi:alkyl hydroperoxide reductase subunit AhpF
MTIMAIDSSATTREEASHTTQTPHVNRTTRTATIVNALKQRAQAVLNDKSLDAQSRVIIRYALETNDPWLAELVRRAERGAIAVDQIDFSQIPGSSR